MAFAVNRPDTAFSLDRRSTQRRPREKANSHLAFIRTLPCLACGAMRQSEAAHIRFGDPMVGKPKTGMGEKPDDKWTVPLCSGCHRKQHATNERSFWTNRGINPVTVAALLWAQTGNEAAGTLIAQNGQQWGFKC